MNYEPNPFNRLLTNLLNELARMRRQFGASHEHIEQVVIDQGQIQRQTTAAIWDEQARFNDEILRSLDSIQSQLAYGFRQDFDRPESRP